MESEVKKYLKLAVSTVRESFRRRIAGQLLHYKFEQKLPASPVSTEGTGP